MTKREFLKKNREDIDQMIKSQCGNDTRINDDERELWVVNDEYWYKLARRNGVKI